MKKVFICLILLILVFSTNSQADKSGLQQRIKVGISFMSNQAFFKVMLQSIKREVEDRLNGRVLVSYAGHSIVKQISDVENMIDQGIDLLLFNAVDSKAAEPAVVIAKEAGIPVVCLDVDAAGPRDIFIGSDNYQAGVLCGQYIVNRLGGNGNVVILNGNPVSSVRKRYNGFTDVIKESQVKIVAEANGDGDLVKSLEETEKILESNSDIDAIFAINDPSALGALAAVEVAGRDEGLIIVGIDGSPDAVKAIIAGKSFKATAAQNPAKIGKLGVENGLKLLRGEQVPDVLPVEVKLIDKSNARGFSW